MFDLTELIKENLVNGVINGCFAKENANIMAVNYLAKGMLETSDVEDISTSIETALATDDEEVESDTDNSTDDTLDDDIAE